ncbi:MAG: hypothetical protein V1799_06220 [bacterium]
MNTLLKLLSLIALIVTILPSVFVFEELISWQTHANIMLCGMILWFIVTPFWMKEQPQG